MIGVWSGTDITSKRCWIRRPDGPAAVSLGKDLKTAPMSKFGSSEKEPARTLGMMGISDAGFLAFNNCQVASLLGAIIIIILYVIFFFFFFFFFYVYIIIIIIYSYSRIKGLTQLQYYKDN